MAELTLQEYQFHDMKLICYVDDKLTDAGLFWSGSESCGLVTTQQMMLI